MQTNNRIKNNFKVKFDCDESQINVNVLINSLIHITSVINEINKELSNTNQIEIKVKALERGSFLVDLDLIESGLEKFIHLFNKENLNTVGVIITIFVGIIEIKKFLKGKKPSKTEKNDSKTIIFFENNKLTIDNKTYDIFCKNESINDSISQNFSVLDEDGLVNGFQVLNENDEVLTSIKKEEFNNLSIKSEIFSENKKIITEISRLNIVRLSFEENLKWDFYFKGYKISAKISDPNFHKSINHGQSFSKGDTLEVELQINQIFDEGVNTYINKSYQINKIIKHIRRNEQIGLSFEE